MAESGKWIYDKCRSERLRLLEVKMQKVLLQIDNLTRKNRALENNYDCRQLEGKFTGGIRCRVIQGGAKYPPYFQLGIVKRGEAVEGWGWARKVQVVGKFTLQPSPVVNMVWSN